MLESMCVLFTSGECSNNDELTHYVHTFISKRFSQIDIITTLSRNVYSCIFNCKRSSTEFSMGLLFSPVESNIEGVGNEGVGNRNLF
jgi:hypothetical protein